MAITAQDVATLRKRTGAGIMDCKNALNASGGDFEQAIDLLRKKGQKISADRLARNASEGAVFACTNSDHTEAFLLVLNCETDFVAKNALFLELGTSILESAVAYKPASIEALQCLPLKKETVQEAVIASVGTIGEKITISIYERLQGEIAVSYIHTGNSLGVLVLLEGAQGENVIAAGRDVAMQIAAMNPVALDTDQIDQSIVAREMAIIQEQVIGEGYTVDKAEKIIQGRLHKFFKENTLLQQPFVKNNKLTVAQYLQSIAPALTVTAFRRISVGT
ncbi:translation elongation factor Ts [Candidatus Cardinium hertigii]|jgi:elongation factor Ts|uniref:Elongation factor Ts n=1 Tax=Candidatus Cardinium hertigii TaxID=247481 RepID=A0A3N2QD90_9BACT|nr:translation elongation factor Ts [Candidatus Cardinium hertigii]ROT47758.1 elongation factor Ts [Candidatus Cardinium hertigii]